MGLVIFDATANDVPGFLRSIGAGQLAPPGHGPRWVLVRQEVVIDPLDQQARTVIEFPPAAVNRIAFHNRNDLITRLVAVQQPDAADGPVAEQDIAVADRLLR